MDSDCLNAIRGNIGAVSHLLKDAQGKFLVDLVILRQQNAQRMLFANLCVHDGFGRFRLWGDQVPGEDSSQGVVKSGWLEGLGQIGGEVQILCAESRVCPGKSTRMIGKAFSSCSLRISRVSMRPSSLGHVHVEDDEVESVHLASIHSSASRGCSVSREVMPHFSVCSVRMRRLVALSSTMRTRLPCKIGLNAFDIAGGLAFRDFGRFGFDGEDERGTFANASTFGVHFTAHHFRETFADGETQTRAAKFAGGG